MLVPSWPWLETEYCMGNWVLNLEAKVGTKKAGPVGQGDVLRSKHTSMGTVVWLMIKEWSLRTVPAE